MCGKEQHGGRRASDAGGVCRGPGSRAGPWAGRDASAGAGAPGGNPHAPLRGGWMWHRAHTRSPSGGDTRLVISKFGALLDASRARAAGGGARSPHSLHSLHTQRPGSSPAQPAGSRPQRSGSPAGSGSPCTARGAGARTVDAGGRVVLDAEVDVLVDAKPKVAAAGSRERGRAGREGVSEAEARMRGGRAGSRRQPTRARPPQPARRRPLGMRAASRGGRRPAAGRARTCRRSCGGSARTP